MVNTHHDDDQDWHRVGDEHEDPQGQGQWKQNSWIHHGITYGNYSGDGSTGEESYILTLQDNMHFEKRECHEEESRRGDAFEAA